MISVKHKRGTTAENDTYVGPAGTVSIDAEKNEMRLHDGTTPGGTVIPNAAALALLEQQINSLTLAAPVFEPLGDVYSINNASISAASATLNGAVVSGTETLLIDNVINPNGLTNNTVLRNETDDDEVVILGFDEQSSTLTTTPTTKAWSDNAALSNKSLLDVSSREAVVVDISASVPQGVSIKALIGQLWVREEGAMSTTVAFRTGPVGGLNNSEDMTDNYPQVSGLWHPSGFVFPVVDNRFAVAISTAGEDFSARVRVSGYYADM